MLEIKKIVLLVTILLLSFSITLADEFDEGNIKQGVRNPEQEKQLAEQIHQEIENTIRSDATLDLQSPKYRNNPEIVKKVLKEKYNLDIDSFTGAKIEGGVLQLAGGTEISLTTGKNIHLEIQGGTVKRYQDADTTILNAEGVKIDSSTKEVKKAEAVKDGETDIQFLQTYKDDGQTTTIAQATLISADNTTINNAKSITLKRSNNKLLHADFVCNADNNQATLNEVQIVCNKNNRVNAEITLSTVDLTIDKGTAFQYQNIPNTPDKNQETKQKNQRHC